MEGMDMGSIYKKRGYLYIGYKTKTSEGIKWIYESTGLKATRENWREAKRVLELNETSTRVRINPFRSIKQTEEEFFQEKYGISQSYSDILHIVIDKLKEVYGERFLSEITDTTKFRERLEKDGLKYNTIVTYHKHLRIFFEFCKKKKYIEENPVPSMQWEDMPIKTIKESDKEIILSFLEKNNIDAYRIIKFLILTGWRVGEAIALSWEQIDFENSWLYFRNIKAKRNEVMYLYPQLKEFMKGFKENKGQVFKYKTRECLRVWRRAIKTLKKRKELDEEVNYTLHQIRKTVATSLVNNKMTMFDAMDYMRWRDIKTMKRYYALADKKRIGMEIDKIMKSEEKRSGKSGRKEAGSKMVVKMTAKGVKSSQM